MGFSNYDAAYTHHTIEILYRVSNMIEALYISQQHCCWVASIPLGVSWSHNKLTYTRLQNFLHSLPALNCFSVVLIRTRVSFFRFI